MNPDELPRLTVREAEILKVLEAGHGVDATTELGVYRKKWTRDDVVHVHRTHFRPLHSVPTYAADRWLPPEAPGAPRTVEITARMADVLDGVCEGLTDEAIADQLGVTLNTIKTHVKRLLSRLGAQSRAHAAALACSGRTVVVIRDTVKAAS